MREFHEVKGLPGLRTARQRRQRSIKELAAKLRCSERTLWSAERGERNTSSEHIRALVLELDVSSDELLGLKVEQ